MKLWNPTVKARLKQCRSLAKSKGYEEIDYQEGIGMVSFQKPYGSGTVRVNIYLTKMTVATCLRHPKKGPTQIFLKHASFGDVEKLFNNPRQHTGRRYYTKENA